MSMLLYSGIFLIGFVIGAVYVRIKNKSLIAKKTMGRLRIDRSEPDEPAKLFLELKNVTPDMISKCKIVEFEVINENYLSRN